MMKPLGDRVIIRVLEKEEKTKSGSRSFHRR